MSPVQAQQRSQKPALALCEDVKDHDIPKSVWVQQCLERLTRVSRAYRWTTDVSSVVALLDPEPLAAQIHLDGLGSVATVIEGAVVYVSLRRDAIFVRVAGEDDCRERARGRIQELFPEVRPAYDDVSFLFWMEREGRGESTPKLLKCPDWKDIEDNYPGAVRRGLHRLMSDFEPDEAGLLLLWHGPPGTGKTWAIQALARRWASWAEFDVVVDPERFFGEGAYMLHVLLYGNRVAAPHKWRVLVLEDTGELLSADAKLRTGQGLSRLLNVTDGLLGRGSKILVLVTSNEDFQTFHPAVARVGRCASQIGFRSFTTAEARAWFAARDHDPSARREGSSLAEMYAELRGEEPDRGLTFGFATSA